MIKATSAGQTPCFADKLVSQDLVVSMSNYLIFCMFAKCSYLSYRDLTLDTHEDIFTICHKLTTDKKIYFGPILDSTRTLFYGYLLH